MATTTVPPKEGTATMPDVEEPESNAIEQENATSSRITSTARAILNRTLSAAKDVSIDDEEPPTTIAAGDESPVTAAEETDYMSTIIVASGIGLVLVVILVVLCVMIVQRKQHERKMKLYEERNRKKKKKKGGSKKGKKGRKSKSKSKSSSSQPKGIGSGDGQGTPDGEQKTPDQQPSGDARQEGGRSPVYQKHESGSSGKSASQNSVGYEEANSCRFYDFRTSP